MKRGIMVAVAAISMAGAASASIFTTSPDSAAAARGAATSQSSAGDVAPDAGKPPPAAAESNGIVAARRNPVPLQVASRPPVRLPSVDASESYAKGEADASAKAMPSASGTDDPALSDDQPGASTARAAIEADGYKGVQILQKGANGTWHAKAMRGRTEVRLVVDATGSVSTAD